VFDLKWRSSAMSLMNPRTEKLVRRLTIVTTITASYFLLTADYGPKPNALDPVSLFLFSQVNFFLWFLPYPTRFLHFILEFLGGFSLSRCTVLNLFSFFFKYLLQFWITVLHWFGVDFAYCFFVLFAKFDEGFVWINITMHFCRKNRKKKERLLLYRWK